MAGQSAVPDSFCYCPPVKPCLEILFLDRDLLVLNKPAGLLSVPGRGIDYRDSLATRVQRYFPQAQTVHRLDMATSGVMVMALNKPGHRALSRQFQDRLVHKLYYAWVWGEPAAQDGTIDLPLVCDWPSRPLQKVDFEYGKPARTHWQVVRTRGDRSLLKLTPETGRSHQLRVHLQALGHPILGDEFYADAQARAAASRLQLHAAELGVCHPGDGRECLFSCAPDFDC